MSWIAEYDTQGREFPTCVHVTKTTGTMTHGATYVPIEDGKAVRAENERLQDENERLRSCLSDSAENAKQIMHEAHVQEAENAKLRMLLAELYQCSRQCGCNHCGYKDWCAISNRMRELVIEVNE